MTPSTSATLHQKIKDRLSRGWSHRMIAGALGCPVETVAEVARAST